MLIGGCGRREPRPEEIFSTESYIKVFGFDSEGTRYPAVDIRVPKEINGMSTGGVANFEGTGRRTLNVFGIRNFNDPPAVHAVTILLYDRVMGPGIYYVHDREDDPASGYGTISITVGNEDETYIVPGLYERDNDTGMLIDQRGMAYGEVTVTQVNSGTANGIQYMTACGFFKATAVNRAGRVVSFEGEFYDARIEGFGN